MILSGLVWKFDYFFISFLLRNYFIMLFINYGTRNKKSIVEKQVTIEKQFRDPTFVRDHIHVFTSTYVESLTHFFIKRYTNTLNSGTLDFWFLYYFFMFEILLDLFHYLSHRFLHSHPWLYRHIHKKHHYHTNPTVINTYYHNVMDLIITLSIPTVLSLWIIPYQFSEFQMHLLLVYKSFIEISGHCGKQLKPSSCFPICIWLPRLLHIELYTEDHHLHHSQSNCNYSKRFSLWDKVFGTYCI